MLISAGSSSSRPANFCDSPLLVVTLMFAGLEIMGPVVTVLTVVVPSNKTMSMLNLFPALPSSAYTYLLAATYVVLSHIAWYCPAVFFFFFFVWTVEVCFYH